MTLLLPVVIQCDEETCEITIPAAAAQSEIGAIVVTEIPLGWTLADQAFHCPVHSDE